MIALQAEKIVPDYMDIKKMIIFQTSGTTGHAMLVPHHPSAAASYEPMIEFVLHQYHLHPAWNPEMVATILVCSQKNTVTCATVATSWEGAGFIKVNLKSSEWGRKNFAGEYLKAMDPFFLNGDPISLAELLKRQIGLRPRAIITTAVALTIGLKKELESFYNCPVIDWYSANETGPIGYTCSENRGFHILPHDIFVEILDVKGNPLPEGKIGEITFTGGRNPFLPLLRYRTGDFAALERKACKCGDPMPRLIHFAGRASVLFKDIKGNTVNPVDVSKILKPFKYVQHQLRQNKNLSLTLRIKPVTDKQKPDEKMIHQTLEKLFGKLPINIIFEPKLGENEKGAKVIPYMSPFKL
jgi:phenylacetate-CoA ligase